MGIEEILGSHQVCAVVVLLVIPEESSNIAFVDNTFYTGPGRMERSCVSS